MRRRFGQKSREITRRKKEDAQPPPTGASRPGGGAKPVLEIQNEVLCFAVELDQLTLAVAKVMVKSRHGRNRRLGEKVFPWTENFDRGLGDFSRHECAGVRRKRNENVGADCENRCARCVRFPIVPRSARSRQTLHLTLRRSHEKYFRR